MFFYFLSQTVRKILLRGYLIIRIFNLAFVFHQKLKLRSKIIRKQIVQFMMLAHDHNLDLSIKFIPILAIQLTEVILTPKSLLRFFIKSCLPPWEQAHFLLGVF